jgi:gluconolactonase
MAGTVACNKAPEAASPPPTSSAVGTIDRLDPGLDPLLAPTATIEKVTGGFKFLEGPLWRSSGVLWFSDLVGNVVHQGSPDDKVTDVLNPGGYDDKDLPEGGYIGPNGMTVGPNNTVTLCQHGNRGIVSVAPDRKVTVLVDATKASASTAPTM